MAHVIIDATKNNEVIGTKKNINEKYDTTISLLKKWTKENFYFNHNVVTYLHDTLYTSALDERIKCNEVIYKKSEFDTALSHLMYVCIAVGKTMEENERIEALEELCNAVGNRTGGFI